MHQGDRTAVVHAQHGDTEAFRSLVERHSRYPFSVAHRMTGSAADAEDVVQEAWLKAHRQLGGFEARADVRTWLHRITVNCAIDFIRARRHREDAHDPADLEQGPLSERGADGQVTPLRLAQSGEIRRRVGEALGHLRAWSAPPSRCGTWKACRSTRWGRPWTSRRAPPSTASFARCARCDRRSSHWWTRRERVAMTGYPHTRHLTDEELVLVYFDECSDRPAPRRTWPCASRAAVALPTWARRLPMSRTTRKSSRPKGSSG